MRWAYIFIYSVELRVANLKANTPELGREFFREVEAWWLKDSRLGSAQKRDLDASWKRLSDWAWPCSVYALLFLIRKLAEDLPKPNRQLLKFLCHFLVQISLNKGKKLCCSFEWNSKICQEKILQKNVELLGYQSFFVKANTYFYSFRC